MHAIKCDRCGGLSEEKGDHRREVEIDDRVKARDGLRAFRVVVIVAPVVWDRDHGPVSDLQLCSDCFMTLTSKAADAIDIRPRVAAREAR